MLELISPAGLEGLFRRLGTLQQVPDPDALAEMAAPFACDVDVEGTGPLAERHGLVF